MMMADVANHKGRSHENFLFSNVSGIRRSAKERSDDGEGENITTSCCSSGEKRPRTTARGVSISPREKDKIGERITRLQQLVSPFGKSDTSSVLQEAASYIKFLHEQLEVLSAPYLHVPVTTKMEEDDYYRLSSRGLCLVPLELTMEIIPQNNGADLWAPAKST